MHGRESMRTIIRCGWLFTGLADTPLADQALVIEGERIVAIKPWEMRPEARPGDTVVDHSAHFVMPGLADMHTHLSYGNALSEEGLDLYGTLEYRTLRALAAAQRMLKSGFTALLDPACSGLTTPAVRDAVFVGMFLGPRITTGGPAITSRQGLYDYYPSWIGCPPCSTGELVKSLPEAIEAIRRQTKDGVDIIKLAMDGIQGGNSGGLYAAFDQDETTAMVREAHRLGRRVAVHARGREGVLYAARAGVDILFHASRIDDEGIRAAAGNGCAICPSLLLLTNNIQFAQPDDPSYDWWPNIQRRELAEARVNLQRARAFGVPILIGSETGFAVTPYGEWSARELQLMVEYLDMSPAEVLRISTHANRAYLRGGETFDSLSTGKLADLLIVDGDPLADIAMLQEEKSIVGVWLGGKPVNLPEMPAEMPRHPSELSQGMWNRLYTRANTRGGQARIPAPPAVEASA